MRNTLKKLARETDLFDTTIADIENDHPYFLNFKPASKYRGTLVKQ